MKILDALAALRSLDTLPEARRRYLALLATDARNDADRALIVMKARDEERRVRERLAVDLKAEFDARTPSALCAEEKPLGAPQRPSGGKYVDEDGVRYPEARPVTISWTQPTKTGQPRPRREGIGKNHKQTEKRKSGPEHGLTGYNKRKCRCGVCRDAKAQSRKKKGLRRRNGGEAEHGTISRYSNNGCRCDECRAATAAYAREWRARKRPN